MSPTLKTSIAEAFGLCEALRDEAEYWKSRFEASQNEVWRLRTETSPECAQDQESLWLLLALLAIIITVTIRVVSRREKANRRALIKKVDMTLQKRLSETPLKTSLDSSPSRLSLLTASSSGYHPTACRDLSPKDRATVAKQEDFLRGLFGDYEKLTPTKSRPTSISSNTAPSSLASDD